MGEAGVVAGLADLLPKSAHLQDCCPLENLLLKELPSLACEGHSIEEIVFFGQEVRNTGERHFTQKTPVLSDVHVIQFWKFFRLL